MRCIIVTIFLSLTILSVPSCAQPAQENEQVPLDVKIGQMLLVGFRGTAISDTNHIKRDLKKYHLGGVILFDYDVPSGSSGRNITSPEQLKDLIQKLKSLSDSHLIVSVDQEGGNVARLKPSLGFPRTVSAEYLGTLNNPDSTQHYARSMGKTLSNLGINMNFAPVLDLNINPNNPIIGRLERSFSVNPQRVAKHASIYASTLSDYDIIPVFKHFPGHGSSESDSHLGVVDVTDTWSEKELIPYRQLIPQNYGHAIMTAHIFNRNIDATLPATLSKPTINGLLREDLGYTGVIISDDLMMGAIRNEYGLKTTIKHAINAGVDLLTFANNSIYDPNIVPKTHRIIKELLEEGKLSREQIDRSYQRITALKKHLQ